ncbi:PTS glucose transporter subunit IIA [Actinomycetes bacterium NPDC127524]
MLRNLFGKKDKDKVEKEIVLFAPVSGKVIPLEEVSDPVFSEKMMGDGLAIDPDEGEVRAPCDAAVIQVFPTKHAIGLKTKNGAEILIHIGLDTVNMKGEGFEAYVKEGDTVKRGQKLVSFDTSLIREKAASTVIPIIITNGELVQNIEKTSQSAAVSNETSFLTVTMK